MPNMRRVAALLAASILLATAPAAAQVFGQFSSAEVLPMNGHEAGFFLNAGDNTLGGLGQLRLSFYPGIDFGFQGGLSRVTWQGVDRTTLRLGADLRVAVGHSGEGFPFDISVGGGLGVETSDDYHVLTLMPSGVMSRSWTLGQSGSIAPYLGLGLSFAHADAGSTNETFLSLPLRLGADLRGMPGMRLSAELQAPLGDSFNDDVGVLTGVKLAF